MTTLPDYSPIPPSALGMALFGRGYFVGRLERNVYWSPMASICRSPRALGQVVATTISPPWLWFRDDLYLRSSERGRCSWGCGTSRMALASCTDVRPLAMSGRACGPGGATWATTSAAMRPGDRGKQPPSSWSPAPSQSLTLGHQATDLAHWPRVLTAVPRLRDEPGRIGRQRQSVGR